MHHWCWSRFGTGRDQHGVKSRDVKPQGDLGLGQITCFFGQSKSFLVLIACVSGGLSWHLRKILPQLTVSHPTYIDEAQG